MTDTVFTLGVDIDTKSAEGGLKSLQKELENTAKSAKGINKGFSEGLQGVSSGIRGLSSELSGLATGGIGGVTDSIIGLTAGLTGVVAGLAAIGAVAVAATGALILNSAAMADAADNAAELADKMGLTTTELATFQLIADENSGSVTGMVSSLDKLTNSLDEVEKGNLKTINSFRSLGVSQEELAGKSAAQVAGILIKNYDALGRSTAATAAMQDVMSKSFRDQLPALRALSTEYKDYQDRIAGTVASKELELAGARQEKAFTNLGLEVDKTKMLLSGFFTDTATQSATWATESIKNVNNFISVLKASHVSLIEAAAIEGMARADAGLFNFKKGGQLAAERTLALDKERQAAIDAGDATKRLNEYRGTSTAGGGRGRVNPPLAQLVPPAPPVKPDALVQAKLTEDQKNTIALVNQMNSAFNDLDRTLALNAAGTDTVSQQMVALQYKLFDTGKGVIDLADAWKLVAEKQKLFEDVVAGSNTKKLNDQLKSMNADYNVQLQLLTATTEQEREQIRLRAQLNALFKDQRGGATPEQAKQTEDALKLANEQYKILQGKKIDNSVRDSMKDLTDQTELLNFEIENYWATNRDGIVNTNNALKTLERQIDPEGRGKNITDAQREQLKGQLELIEAKKQELIVNQQIDDSYKTLGSAVSNWALGTQDAIKGVRLAFLQLIITTAFRSTISGGGAGGSFISGILGGLSGARAEGGPVSAGGSYLVGEKGPEVVKFKQSGYVIPNSQISGSSPRTTVLTLSPNLIIQGSVTGQTELENMFDQFASEMANQTQQFVINQRGQNGILAR